jgi:phosphomannomutase
LGEDRYKKLVNFILRYIADMDIPIKRYVVDMLNLSPPNEPSSLSEELSFV